MRIIIDLDEEAVALFDGEDCAVDTLSDLIEDYLARHSRDAGFHPEAHVVVVTERTEAIPAPA